MRRHTIIRRDGRWFYHPWTFGVMPNHPTGYTGKALWHDPQWWAMTVRYRHESGQMASWHTPRSRWRVMALLHALLGHTEARP